jgi:hypothetical protein
MIKSLKKFSRKIKITPRDLVTKPEYDFVLTSDFFRADLGYIIVRLPIFYDFQQKDLDNLKIDSEMNSLYQLQTPIHDGLLDFKKTSYLESGRDIDDKPTHRVTKNGKDIIYRANSKNFKYADPNVRDHKSIQHQGLHPIYFITKQFGRWRFPSFPLSNRDTANIYKENFAKKNIPNANIIFTSSFPVLVNREEIEKEEIEKNEIFAKFKGKKIFYYEALHDSGIMSYEDAEDWAWVTKFEMKNFFSEEYFQNFSFLHHRV